MARIVVLSPHSDDGVLSLGASMARWARSGRDVRLVTVLALDPGSTAASGGWDRRAGFSTEGEAARVRQDEDRAASEILGVTPSWLPFGSVDYDRHGDDASVWAALAEATDGAELVLVPGHPLTHSDHAWLNRLARDRLAREAIALYAEQPYTLRDGATPFAPATVSARDRLAKWRAVRSYRSQLPLLAMARTLSRGPMRLSSADERVRWPEGHDGSL